MTHRVFIHVFKSGLSAVLMLSAAGLHCAASEESLIRFIPPENTARDRLFNDSWLFYRGDVLGAEDPSFNDSEWRELDLPHDWSVESGSAENQTASLPEIEPVFGEWRYISGDADEYAGISFDDSGWMTTRLPAPVLGAAPRTYYWFRRAVVLTPEQAQQGVQVDLGRIDDCDEFYINGQKVGDTGVMPKNQPQGNCIPAFDKQRIYKVSPELLHPGSNLLAVCVYNNRGPCGFFNASSVDSDDVVGPFSRTAVGGTHSGYTVGGTGWYRKHFTVGAMDAGKHYEIYFGGIYMNSDVWINGHHLGFHPYGYTGLYYDLTPYLRSGTDNVIAVRVRNEGITSRWYTGSGIYRNVWLTQTAPVFIRRWGVQILTPEADERQALVHLNIEIEGDETGCALQVHILDADGRQMAEGQLPVAGNITPLVLTVQNPQLWSIEHPVIYTTEVTLLRAGRSIDKVCEPFGIRTIAYSVDKGFQLNGKTIKMWGGCLHHDNGILGSTAFDRAEFRKLEIMKKNGYNAVRTAHNPMSDAFYDACDRLGLLVMDEVFDQWNVKKTPQDYGGKTFEQWYARDIELWLRRVRNHPSIVILSLGNEIGNREKDEPILCDILRKLKTEVRKWDTSRPVTGGNATAFSFHNFLSLYDVKGYNYREDKMDQNQRIFPDWVAICTESQPSGNGQLDTWNFVNDRSWVTGSFVWSAQEYIGESWSGWIGLDGETAGWPSYAAACGLIDIAGFPKGGQLFRNVISGTSAIELLVLEPLPEGRSYQYKPWSWPNEYPCWGWSGFEGRSVEVKIVCRAPQVRLSLNGKIIGEGTTEKSRIANVFTVPYEPGELVAEGLQDGAVICRKTLSTPGKPAALRLTADRMPVTANRNDLAFVTVEVVDAQGAPVQTGRYNVRYRVDGSGSLAACGNGYHRDIYSFRNPDNGTTWRGRSLAVLRPDGTAGDIRLTVESDQFPSVQLRVPVID